MRFNFGLLAASSFGIVAVAEENQCPDTDLACHDIMNSSQCIFQVVLQGNGPPTREAMIKCVEHEGTASNLPGAVKYCRCPGCHTQPINEAIVELFPPPCA